jgi:hypothetical protein
LFKGLAWGHGLSPVFLLFVSLWLSFREGRIDFSSPLRAPAGTR